MCHELIGKYKYIYIYVLFCVVVDISYGDLKKVMKSDEYAE